MSVPLEQLPGLLSDVARGVVSPADAERRIVDIVRRQPFADLGFARVDLHRPVRQGFPEVVFGAGKTPAQVAAIAERLVAAGQTLLVTRTDAAAFAAVRETVPDATFHQTARCITRRAAAPTRRAPAKTGGPRRG